MPSFRDVDKILKLLSNMLPKLPTSQEGQEAVPGEPEGIQLHVCIWPSAMSPVAQVVWSGWLKTVEAVVVGRKVTRGRR